MEKAKIDYERALGRTLDVNRVSIADARSGTVERDTLIPGNLSRRGDWNAEDVLTTPAIRHKPSCGEP